jgi:signal transduction histidine kinase
MMLGQVITAHQDALSRLQRLDRAKRDFLTTVNHELQTPLTCLTAYLDLIDDGAGGEIPPRARAMFHVAQRNANRLRTLIDDVVTITRSTANEPELNWTPVHLTPLLRGVLKSLRRVADAGSVAVSLAEVGRGFVVEGDAIQLHQVFRNIADNAVKFTPPGGRIDVGFAECLLAGAVAGVRVTVADSGIGIPEEEMPDLFTSFFRASNAQAGAIAGSGLGLAIVRRLVDAHGGAVSISQTPGGGTTVAVTLPLGHHREPARAAIPATGQAHHHLDDQLN